MKYPHIAARLFDQPLLIEAGKLSTIVAALGPRFNPDVDWGMADPAYSRQTAVSDTGYLITGGVGIIPVIGTLVHRGSNPNSMSGLTGYDALSEWFQAALLDPEVKSILLELDTPGGEVAGAFDFADQVYNARGIKPIAAMVSDRAASAGYLIASAADEIITTRTGITGSVGVVTAHIDLSKAAANEGVVITHIFAGAHKIDGHSYAPLADPVRERFQQDVSGIYELFTQTVARNRGLTQAAVRATEALTYRGEAAIAAGFVDKVSTKEAALAAMSVTHGRKAGSGLKLSSKSKESRMEKDDANNPVAGITEEQLNSAVASAAAKARMDERARIRAIMQSEAAVGRAEMTEHLAFETDMEAQAAIALLGKAPVAAAMPAPAATTGALAAAMAAIEQPNISASDAGDDNLTGNHSQAAANVIISDFRRATGKK